jgi:hypothetical protein
MESAMNTIKVTVGLVLVLVLVLSYGVFAQEPNMNPVGFDLDLLDEILRTSHNGLAPDPTTLWIAVSETSEHSPAVAHGGDQQVVVYVKEDRHGIDNIYAAVISDESTKPLLYPITNHTSDCAHPDIAYHVNSGLFIVVYENTRSGIFMQAITVELESLELVGKPELISEGEIETGSPAIACNQSDKSCLIAYHHDHSRIKGRYINLSSSGMTGLSNVYDLSDAAVAGRPYLAWGKAVGTYLLTYSQQNSEGAILPEYTHVIDHDDPLLAIKFLHPSTSAVPSNFSPLGYNALVRDATFDPCTQKFLISFDYDAEGDGSNYDVWAAVVHSTEPINFTWLPIADTHVSEHSSAISFLSDGSISPACGSMDRLLAGYINEAMGLMAVELTGNSSVTSPVYIYDGVMQHLLIENHTNMYWNHSVRISSGSQDGPVLMVYEIKYASSGDYDIWGKYLSIDLHHLAYLPLILR